MAYAAAREPEAWARPVVPPAIAQEQPSHIPYPGGAAQVPESLVRIGTAGSREWLNPYHSVVRTFSPATLRAMRWVIALAGLVPLTLILAVKVASLAGDPILSSYGLAVFVFTMVTMLVAFAGYRDRSATASLVGARPTVTMLVAVHNELGQVESCVDSLLDSDYVPLEVIVIDDSSTDGTADLLRRLAADKWSSRDSRPETRFRLITLDRNVGKKRALIAGVEQAQGQVLAFTDSDCILAPDAIRRCVMALMARPDVGAVSGHVRALNARTNFLTRIQDVWYDGQFGVQKAAESFFGTVFCVSGPLAVFRREAIYNYMPAWANDRFAGGEFRFATDRQLTAYVLGQAWIGERLKGRYQADRFVTSHDYPVRRWRVEYVRSARAWTNVPDNARSFFRQQVRWKKSFIRNMFFNGGFLWRRGPASALLYYPHLIFVLAAPVLAFRHLALAPLDGLWLVTGLYIAGVFLKGSVWAIAYRIQNPGATDWVYRPFMSVVSAVLLSWLIVYSVLTLRNMVWHRG